MGKINFNIEEFAKKANKKFGGKYTYDCGCLCYKWKKKNEETNN